MAQPYTLIEAFRAEQLEKGMALAEASDLLDLKPLGPSHAPAAYLARFHCRGLVRCAGRVMEHDDFLLGIRFPDDYLTHFDTGRVLTWCEPPQVLHPNIRTPYVCVGRMLPATPLVDLLYQVHEIITYQNVDMQERNALNHHACAWARNNQHRFPVDRRPLKRRTSPAEA